MRTSLAVFMVMLACGVSLRAEEPAGGTPAADATALSKEERQRRYAAIQKELEAARPAENGTQEEIVAFLEMAMDSYGKFARQNSKTPEGFEAAFSLAGLLASTQHPDAMKYAQLAAETAPAAGIDMRRVAYTHVLIAQGCLRKQDLAAAKAEIEKIKDINEATYEEYSAQLDVLLKKQTEAQQVRGKAQEQLQIGKEPFAIDEVDLNGLKVSLAALKGKVVIVDFWATWCGPCMHEVPGLKALYALQKARGLEIVGISLDKDTEELKQTIQDRGILWPVILDTGGLADKWGVDTIPRTYLLDRKGIIRQINLRGDDLASAVKKLLEDR